MSSADPSILKRPGPLLEGRIALITGGGGGIGAATAALFALHGAHVVIADIDEELSAATVEQVRTEGGAITSIVTDVRDDAQVLRLRDRVLAELGRVDVLVNNVGHWVEHLGEFVDGNPSHWDALYRVNLHHVFTVTHAFLPSMIERQSGSIINVSSVEGLRGYPAEPVYGALKAAVVHFTKCLGVQVGRHGVRVNGIGPDVTESLQVPYSKWVPEDQAHLWPLWVPVGRMGVPADQARVLLFLASDLSAFVTGHTIPTDGGTGAHGGWFRSTSRPGRTWTNRPVAP
jgi:NAD(P)-dependent dehydrogenase (short-subunit alcohol dehydrogenase family)